jgi:hypothetical protein
MADAEKSVPGMPCPDCGTPIVLTLQQLLSRSTITCKCGLKISVDEQRSRETLRDLRALQTTLRSIPR